MHQVELVAWNTCFNMYQLSNLVDKLGQSSGWEISWANTISWFFDWVRVRVRVRVRLARSLFPSFILLFLLYLSFFNKTSYYGGHDVCLSVCPSVRPNRFLKGKKRSVGAKTLDIRSLGPKSLPLTGPTPCALLLGLGLGLGLGLRFLKRDRNS